MTARLGHRGVVCELHNVVPRNARPEGRASIETALEARPSGGALASKPKMLQPREVLVLDSIPMARREMSDAARRAVIERSEFDAVMKKLLQARRPISKREIAEQVRRYGAVLRGVKPPDRP
jgi:hypothetical protein